MNKIQNDKKKLDYGKIAFYILFFLIIMWLILHVRFTIFDFPQKEKHYICPGVGDVGKYQNEYMGCNLVEVYTHFPEKGFCYYIK